MKQINWRNHLIEFITVVIGILIGFSLNSWNETRQEKKQSELYLERIKTEIEDNLREVEDKLVYHDTLLAKLRRNPAEVNLIIRASNTKKNCLGNCSGQGIQPTRRLCNLSIAFGHLSASG